MKELFSQLPTIAVIISGVSSQFVKFLIKIFKERRVKFEWLYRGYGGMPSSHTAFMTSMATSVYLIEGMSILFLFSIGMMFIVIQYVLDIKFFFDLSGRYVDDMVGIFTDFGQSTQKKFDNIAGHTVNQVIAGFLIGLFVTLKVFGQI